MKQIINVHDGNYTFNASTRQVTITGMSSLVIEQILSIVNITSGEIIFLPGTKGGGGIIAGNIITLDYDTTHQSNSDKLQIYIELDIYYEVTIFDENGKSVGIDAMTNSLRTADIAHSEIHEEHTFSVHHHKPVYTTGTPVYFLKQETINICFHTSPGSTLSHMIGLVDSSKIAFFRILRDVTITDGTGSDFTPQNRYEGSSEISILDNAQASPTANRVRLDATFSGGSLLHSEVLGTGKEKSGTANGPRDLSEYIRAPDTNYAIELSRPNVAGDGLANIELIWYEHLSS
jgi:hypothetical protein